MPRQLQLTQNLLDRAATVWNVVYGTVSFLINFPSHFEAFVKWIDSLDPSQALASSKIGAYLLNSAARQADGAWKAAKGRALQRKGHTNPVDESPSEHWVEVHADSHHLREGRVGFVSVEVLQAGGWTRANMGDAFSAEDVFVLLIVDGGVGQTNTKDDAVAPAWKRNERRAFRFPVADPAATLFCGVFDQYGKTDWPIGRCSIALRALAPSSTYDCWLPLLMRGSDGEALAARSRALVADEPLATAASAHETQAESRGAVRLRIKVEWIDGGVAACRSALTDVAYAPTRAVVATPATASGRRLRENCRFALFGQGGCPTDALNEPFQTSRISGYAHEGMADALNAIISVETGFKKLVAYERPLRSLLALFAWITIVQRPVRLVGWLAVAMFLQLRDALKGDAAAPPLARAPFTLHSWAASTIMGVPLPAPSQVDDAAAQTFARGEAHRAATATFLARERRKANEKRVEKKKEQAKKEALAKPKPLKSFRSMNPLAPLFRPVQRFLLSVVRRQRTVRALLRGRDDPVATATAAAACFFFAVACFVYSELAHPLVLLVLDAVRHVYTMALYALGVLLLGPQNYVFNRLRRRRERRRALGLDRSFIAILRDAATHDPKGDAARLMQRNWRAMRKRKFAARQTLSLEGKAAARLARLKKKQEEKAARDEAKAKAARRRSLERAAEADREALDAMKDRLTHGPIHARRALDGCGKEIPQVLSLDESSFAFGAAEMIQTHIPIDSIKDVSLYDVRRPDVVRFKSKSLLKRCGCGRHRKFVFKCADERDAELLVGALRALTALPVDARRNLSRDFDKGGASRSDGVTRLDDELLVPAKPFGFLAAALNEYEPARPEVHRSRVRPDPRRSLLARVSFRGESLLRGEPVRGA